MLFLTSGQNSSSEKYFSLTHTAGKVYAHHTVRIKSNFAEKKVHKLTGMQTDQGVFKLKLCSCSPVMTHPDCHGAP
jgi:hypothetical protein